MVPQEMHHNQASKTDNQRLRIRDVPLWIKLVLAFITILSAVNTYTSTFTDQVDKISVESAEGRIVIDNIEASIKQIETDLTTVQTATAQNSQSIVGIESDVKNLEHNQTLVNDQLTRMNNRLDKIIDILLENGN